MRTEKLMNVPENLKATLKIMERKESEEFSRVTFRTRDNGFRRETIIGMTNAMRLFGTSEESIFTFVNIYDKYTCMKKFPIEENVVTAYACAYIAAKIEDDYYLPGKDICETTGLIEEALYERERDILNVLGWNFFNANSLHFLDYYTHNMRIDHLRDKIINTMHACLRDFDLARMKPSILTAASIYYVMLQTGIWTQDQRVKLTENSGVNDSVYGRVAKTIYSHLTRSEIDRENREDMEIDYVISSPMTFPMAIICDSN